MSPFAKRIQVRREKPAGNRYGIVLRPMPSHYEDDVTNLIRLWQTGNRDAEARLFELVLPELRRIAHRLMRRERQDHTLQASDLVSQIYLKLVLAKNRTWNNRGHFFALAARAMRNYLIDYARTRPDVQFVTLDAKPFEGLAVLREDRDTLLNLNLLLDQLSKENPEACSIVELKYFLGLNDDEAADMLGLNVRTFQRRWQDARRWLYVKMRGVKGRAQGA